MDGILPRIRRPPHPRCPANRGKLTAEYADAGLCRVGDYGLTLGGRLVAAVERKSLVDLVASLTGGKLRYALAEVAALPRAALVVEDRYSHIFA